MKKLLLTLGACAMAFGAYAAENTVIWSGDANLSWDYNERIQVRNDALANLIEGDQILFTVTNAYKSESQQWPQIVVRPISDGNATLFNIGLWDDVNETFPIVKSYTIAYGDAEMLDQLRQGFDLAGDNVTISEVAVAHTGNADAVMPDNAVWYDPEGEEVTWGEGIVISADVIAGIQPGQYVNIAVKSINEASEWPQVFLCADWVNVIQYMLWEVEGEFPCTVSYKWTSQVAKIFDGIQMRVRGDGATITAVTISDEAEGEIVSNWVYEGEEEDKGDEPGTDDPDTGSVSSIEANNGVVVYNLNGVKILESDNAASVNTLPKGLYIVNGKKVVVK